MSLGLAALNPAVAVGTALAGGAADMYTSKRSMDRAEDMNNNNIAMQREFAQNGIRWKVEDAKAAGLHPLAAIGANTASFTPVSAVGESYFPGKDIADMGQNITRAMSAGMTPEERETNRLKNALLVSQIEETDQRRDYMRSKQMGEAMDRLQGASKPVPGKNANEFGAITYQPDKVVSRDPGDASRTAGKHSLWRKYSFMPGMDIDLIQSDDPAESLEGIGALGLTMFRNLLYRPSAYLERTLYKALDGYREYNWKEGNRQSNRDPHGLVSSPSR